MPLYSSSETPWYSTLHDTTQMSSPNHQYLNGFNQNIPNSSIPTSTHQVLGQNEQDGQGKTQLHRAIIGAFTEEVEALLFGGAAVNVKDHSGNEPLHYAVLSGILSIVKDLLRFGADPNAKNQLGRTPLHVAILNQEITATLLLNGAMASAQDHSGDTPLHLILPLEIDDANLMTVIETLISSSANVDLANNTGFTPFHRLAERSEYSHRAHELFIKFLQLSAGIDAAFPDGKSLFYRFLAVSKESWLEKPGTHSSVSANKVFKQFLEKGADPLTLLSSSKPLACEIARLATQANEPDLAIGELLCMKAPIGPVMSNGNSVLHELCLECRNMAYRKPGGVEGWMELLLKRGADPNLRNDSGQSPFFLLFSHKENKLSIVQRAIPVLLAHGANPTLADESGHPVLFKAANMLPLEGLKPLAQAAIKQHKARDLPVVTDSNLWSYQLEQAVQTQDWEEARDFILNSQSFIPSDIEEKITRSILAALAEKHVVLVRSMFKEDLLVKEKRRKYLATILRDCREQGIEIDMAHLDCLLEFCD